MFILIKGIDEVDSELLSMTNRQVQDGCNIWVEYMQYIDSIHHYIPL